jgi:hypothetical protein
MQEPGENGGLNRSLSFFFIEVGFVSFPSLSDGV